MLEALGFSTEPLGNLTWLLRSADRRTALAVMLRETETAEAGAPRFNNLSPISYALAKADAENLPWVVMVQGNRLRVYSTSIDAGVGRRGRTETFIECQPSLLSDEDLPFLWLLYSAEALSPGGSFSQILDASHRFSGDLAVRLRERIYDDVVPLLAEGIASARHVKKYRARELSETYEMALTVLFRLLFIAYAEDRDLLPYRFNEAYRRRSLKQKALELADCVANDVPIAAGDAHWREVALLWRAVADGNGEWGIPAYNGGLFSDDPDISQVGAELASITLPNESFESALRALLVIDTAENVPGPVDFRSLGVREFGTIYEGLLESELAVASTDLGMNKGDAYVPAKKPEDVVVASGNVYLHNRSGVRKASGSYFTKSFAVNHLLDGALEPALADHLARLNGMDDIEAAERFFDFRVADIAMGSAHFLIGAIDRIEKGMADYLATRNLPGVRQELAGLRNAANESLGELAESSVIEDGQLLRRLIARRCIYGVDASALSVQLARLAIWIHTFVPGLPLSLLDRTLVLGNSLVGVGTVNEVRDAFAEAKGTLFEVDADKLLGVAAEPLNRLANINDATLNDIAQAREAMRDVRDSTHEAGALCDLITARTISEDKRVVGFAFEDWERLSGTPYRSTAIAAAKRDLAALQPNHFPVAFPEVFLRDRPGFDVLIGNPPWKKPKIEEHAFWARHFPGLRSLQQRDWEREKKRLYKERPDLVSMYEAELEETRRMRNLLLSGPYPEMGTGDADLYKAFCWRFWHLANPSGGRIGIVLPHSALVAKGSTEFRLTLFGESARVDVTMLLNNRRWVFDEVHPQYTIGLVCIERGEPKTHSVRLSGPYTNRTDFLSGIGYSPVAFDSDDVLMWNDTVSLPLLPSPASAAIFAQLRKAPRLDLDRPGQWRARPDREMDATKQKPLMDLQSKTCPEGYWPVYKGESFDIWNPDTGVYYAWADPEPARQFIYEKRLRSAKLKGTAHGEFLPSHLRDAESLPCFSPRIAFRDSSRGVAEDTRTFRLALIPPRVFVAHQAPYFLWPRGDAKDEAFLLGVLSSVPLDWYARRFVDKHLSYFLINPFPIPRPGRDDVRWRRVVEIAGRLACPDDRFEKWATSVGVEYGPVATEIKDDLIHELDAVVAHLYGLTEIQTAHVFETFHKGWDYTSRLDGVLRHYRSWRGSGV